ncbi:uncharacterized protein LOC142563584 [Dermacentor variabilis]|uniref:uncharacterized protein LOC142563584 n=1 Tax=Dermacentor variabilis TaxID=34621 RepID=UPI003F5AECC8
MTHRHRCQSCYLTQVKIFGASIFIPLHTDSQPPGATSPFWLYLSCCLRPATFSGHGIAASMQSPLNPFCFFMQVKMTLMMHQRRRNRKSPDTKKAVLSRHVNACFSVDENGKITRLRRECPSEDCGAGVFMAAHFDRQYCGKCCLTYVYNKPDEK